MKQREESFHAIDIAKFYIHDKHDIVLTGSFRHSIRQMTSARVLFTHARELDYVSSYNTHTDNVRILLEKRKARMLIATDSSKFLSDI